MSLGVILFVGKAPWRKTQLFMLHCYMLRSRIGLRFQKKTHKSAVFSRNQNEDHSSTHSLICNDYRHVFCNSKDEAKTDFNHF